MRVLVVDDEKLARERLKTLLYEVVPLDDILYFCVEDGLTKLRTRLRHYWMEPSLADLETRLPAGRFFRISRQKLISLDKVREVVPLTGGHSQVKLEEETVLDVSRRRMKPLMQCLQGL